MKINKICYIMLFVVIMIFSGCSKVVSFRVVKELYPNAEIQQVPGQPYQWIIYNSNSILWIESYGITLKTTNDAIVLFKLNKG